MLMRCLLTWLLCTALIGCGDSRFKDVKLAQRSDQEGRIKLAFAVPAALTQDVSGADNVRALWRSVRPEKLSDDDELIVRFYWAPLQKHSQPFVTIRKEKGVPLSNALEFTGSTDDVMNHYVIE